MSVQLNAAYQSSAPVGNEISFAQLIAEVNLTRCDLLADQIKNYTDETAKQNARLGEIAELQKKLRELLDQFKTTDVTAKGDNDKQVKSQAEYQYKKDQLFLWAASHNFTLDLSDRGTIETAITNSKTDAESLSGKVQTQLAMIKDTQGKYDLSVQEFHETLKRTLELCQRIISN